MYVWNVHNTRVTKLFPFGRIIGPYILCSAVDTLNSFKTLNYIEFRCNNTRKPNTSKQERNNRFLENCLTVYINERIEFAKQRIQIYCVFIIFFILYT